MVHPLTYELMQAHRNDQETTAHKHNLLHTTKHRRKAMPKVSRSITEAARQNRPLSPAPYQPNTRTV